MVGVKCISMSRLVASSSLPPTDPFHRKRLKKAIGAGIFRDRDTSRSSKENKTLFDSILINSVGENEGDVEKKLRRTGEWLIHKTQRTSSSAGKQILVVVFQWILPMWILAFVLASRMLNLPFLDDLLL